MTSSKMLYTKNAANEHNSVLVTHTTCFDIQFDSYYTYR
jgi:hypothetical protein